MSEKTSETNTTGWKVLLTKVLAIVGFISTLVGGSWIVSGGVVSIPAHFAELASLARSLESGKSGTDLVIKTKDTVVKSDEPFTISWNEGATDGVYHFRYDCGKDVTVILRNGDAEKGIPCTEAITLPATMHELSLRVTSEKNRLIDVPLILSVTDTQGTIIRKGTIKMTVTNSDVAFGEPSKTKTVPTPKHKASVPKSETPSYTTSQSITPSTYPQFESNGFVDLRVSTEGVGRISDQQFVYMASYDTHAENAIIIDVKNVGTKTSDTWELRTDLPTGTTYTSGVQSGLKPNEHVTFTIRFGLDSHADDTVKITSTVETTGDKDHTNDTSVWHVRVDR